MGQDQNEGPILLYRCLFGHVTGIILRHQQAIRPNSIVHPPTSVVCFSCPKQSSRHEGHHARAYLVHDQVAEALYRLGGQKAAEDHVFGRAELLEGSREALKQFLSPEKLKEIYGEEETD